MKVYTKTVFQMTDKIGEYIPVSQDSYEYEGPVALAKGGEKGQAKSQQQKAAGQEDTFSGRAGTELDAITPTLVGDVTNPKGLTPEQEARANTANSQSLGGSMAGATTAGNLAAGRTRNPGGFGAAIAESARGAGRTLAQNSLKTEMFSDQLAQEKQQNALKELGGLYGTNVSGLSDMFKNANAAENTEIAADQATQSQIMGDIGMGLNIATTPFGGGAAKNGLAGLA